MSASAPSCIVLLVATLSAQTAGQLAEAFIEAVRTYQGGDVEGAAGALAGWSRRDFDRVNEVVVTRRDWPLVSAAAMMHTELALRRRVGELPAVVMHLGLAESLVQAIPATQSSQFHRQWYLLAASILLAHTSPESARRVVERGLRLFPTDAPLHLLAGIVEETRAHFEDPECSAPGCEARGPQSRARPMLALAESEYRRARELDGQLAEATLRLGRVLFLTNQRAKAREELTALASQPGDARLHYLTRLFLGAVAAYENDFGTARREYEAAVSLAPAHQTAYLALSFAEQMAGSAESARRTMSAMSARPLVEAANPWLDYLNGGGVNADSLQWLRKDVQR